MVHWLAEHWPDVVVATILAVVFAIIYGVASDALNIGSRVREVFRRVNNKRAERSVARLAARIKELEQRRDMLSSDRAIMLLTMQAILRTLGLLALATAAFVATVFISTSELYMLELHMDISSYTKHSPVLATTAMAFFVFILAASSATSGLKVAVLDRSDRLAAAIAQYDAEIAGLKRKLENKLDDKLAP